ncbi:signal transduction protein PmrD [Citrobacter amalonaticus]|uniref:Signal transduction protein PmrD n=1 Tax=Citrobacter amalonaticus TaxID=35703 RepID=A0A2S4S3D9_CITAM|nr:signal transduction protein PmrD [Citrobacter amalonaticus]POT59787.1 signal transduction protein PmrD [Citrobacter amalonaticus]POT77918.1 signal transduction protein PmrD [Citrobacter amalonaticus]POU68370.1 signal transduction protein PmrD [Citrobacter amalonaticus]POV07973.1 signal transduction protein PmrD [Citrobacter amalonaticus]
MEWLVKKSCYDKKSGEQVLVLSDAGGSLKMIAEVKTDIAVNPGDILSPMKDALYCINREKGRTVKILDAKNYTSEEWERLSQRHGKV